MLFAALEVLSFFSYNNNVLMEIGFFAVLAVIFAFSFWRPEYGVYFLLAELFLGGKGYLLGFNGISLRIAIFCVILGIWAGKMIVKKQKPDFLKNKLFKYYFALSVFVFAGIIIGYLRGNGFHNIVLDANAWVYFLVIFPVFETLKDGKRLKNVLQIFLAAIAAISLKTIGLFLIFARSGFDLAAAQAGGARADSLIYEIYKWVRNSGAGEITPFEGFYRIFLQSQVFVMMGFFVLLWLLENFKLSGDRPPTRGTVPALHALLALSAAALLISFSRSFWVGLVAGGLVFLYFLVKQIKWREAVKFSARCGLAIIAGIFIVFAIAPGIFNASGGRISAGTEEKAVSSRMNLLPELWRKIKENPFFGSGFGATVAYESNDPRLVASQLGKYKTYAFEWGYLDIWMKLGFFGFFAYLFLIYKIFREELKNGAPNYGLFCGLLALCATNVFSPYLNHPLGIGAVILIGLAGQIKK
jgi:O-antigen ligase